MSSNFHSGFSNLGNILSNTAKLSNTSFPLCTLPNFEMFGEHTRELSSALVIAFAPRVEHKDRPSWEAYSASHQSWANVTTENVTGYIHRITENGVILREQDNDLYAPIWQVHPSPFPDYMDAINFNLYNLLEFTKMVELTESSREPSMSGMMEIHETIFLFGGEEGVDTDAVHPHWDEQASLPAESIFVVPVFETPEDKTSTIVGHIMGIVSWPTRLQRILSESSFSVHAVVEESCGHTYTYWIDGASSQFVGVNGDAHDPKFDYLRESAYILGKYSALRPCLLKHFP